MSGDAHGDTRVYRPPAAGPRLRVLAGPAEEVGREFPLEGPVVTIGRRADQRIVLSDPSVSRAHARIEVGASEIAVVDLGSTNGTVINGHRLRSGRAGLRAGDRIRLGIVLLEFLP